MFDNNIKFKYSWRPYQERVLKNAQKYLQDGKVNIVAAPGSGKTVLGLELLRRLNNPVLILAPTVTIKNQWVDRFVKLFMDVKETPEWISTNIYDLKKFNAEKIYSKSMSSEDKEYYKQGMNILFNDYLNAIENEKDIL